MIKECPKISTGKNASEFFEKAQQRNRTSKITKSYYCYQNNKNIVKTHQSQLSTAAISSSMPLYLSYCSWSSASSNNLSSSENRICSLFWINFWISTAFDHSSQIVDLFVYWFTLEIYCWLDRKKLNFLLDFMMKKVTPKRLHS